MSSFVIVNVAWNHSGWARLEPNPNVGFGYAKNYGKGAFSPHESLDFDFSKKGIDTNDTVFGYFQTKGTPRRFVTGGLIFFWSKNTDDRKGYFIGVYGNARVIDPKRVWKHAGFETGEFWSNIQGEKKLSCLFPCPVEDSGYVPNKKRLIYRSNLSYDFDKYKALKLLNEAKGKSCGNHSDSGAIATLTAIEEYVRINL